MRAFTVILIALAILKPGLVKGDLDLLEELEKQEDNDLKAASSVPDYWMHEPNYWIPDKDGNAEIFVPNELLGTIELIVNATFTVGDVKDAIFSKSGSPFCPWKVMIHLTDVSDFQTPLKTNMLIKPILEQGGLLWATCRGCRLQDKDCEKRRKSVKGIPKNGIH